MRGFVHVSGLFGLVAGAACTLVVSVDGLSAGVPRALDDDSGPASDDAEVVTDNDASPADGSSDVGVIADVDVSDAVDAAAACTGAHLFCDDFDTNPLAVSWSTSQIAGPVALDSTRFASSPRSVLFSVQPANGDRGSCIRRTVGVSGNKARVELDLFTNGPSGTSYVQVDWLALHLFPPPSGQDIQAVELVDFRSNGASRQLLKRYTTNGAGEQSTETPVVAPFGQWLHIEVNVDFARVPALATLKIDGFLAGTRDLLGTSLTSIELHVGPCFVRDANVSWQLSYDNVTVD